MLKTVEHHDGSFGDAGFDERVSRHTDAVQIRGRERNPGEVIHEIDVGQVPQLGAAESVDRAKKAQVAGLRRELLHTLGEPRGILGDDRTDQDGSAVTQFDPCGPGGNEGI